MKGKSILQARLNRIVLLVVSLAYVLVFFAVASDLYTSYRRLEMQSQQTQIRQVASQIDTVQRTIQSIASLIIYNEVVQNQVADIHSADATHVTELVARSRIDSTLREYLHVVDGTDEILLFAKDGEAYTTRYVRGVYDLENSGWYQSYKSRNVSRGFSAVHKAVPMQSSVEKDVISYLSDYFSVEKYNEKLGELCIDVDLKTFLNSMQMSKDGLVQGVCLLDATGSPLYQDGTFDFPFSEILEGYNDGFYIKNGEVCAISDDMEDGWVLVSQLDSKALIVQTMRPLMKILLIFVLTWLALTVILRFALSKLVNPIHELSKATEKVASGDFSTKVEIHTGDEVEELAETFNDMVVSINDLMTESVNHEKELQKIKTENLILQINPHFIYNTLNSIVYMARMNGNMEIVNFTNAFISLLQNTLRVHDTVYTTVDNEIKNIRNYLQLQEYRYAKKFTYDIICPNDVLNCQILNVTLQPVVENAIFHGIAPKDGSGKIKICFVHDNTMLKIRISDDGIGMSEETLADLLNESYVQKSGIHKIGLGNVRRRIQEIYGAPYTLTVQSEVNKGTIVVITVPFRPLGMLRKKCEETEKK